MKTAQEWRAVWQGDCCPLPDLDQIQAIQADAYRAGLLRAAQVCRNVASIHSNPSIIEEWTQAAERIEAEIEQISREKASLVQIIRDKHAALTKVEADAAAMRERMKELEHSDQMWDEHMSPFTDYEGDEAPWKTMAREFETLRATATRRLELLREVEGPVSDVVAFGNCDCDIPNGKTCLTCQLAIIHKALAAELKEAK